MSIKIDFDPDDFSRKLEKAVKDSARTVIDKAARELQAACDQVYRGRKGKSTDQLFADLRSKVRGRSMPINIPDENLKAYASAIAEGRRVKVEVSGL